MPKANRIATTLIVACAGLAVATSLTATAGARPTTSKATLSSTEYLHLKDEAAALKKFFHSKPTSWNPAYAACAKAGTGTALERSIRTGCDDGIGLDVSLSGFFTKFGRCYALSTGTTPGTTTTGTTTTGTTTTGTTTTGTTTTGLSNTTLQLYACLDPEYQVISRSSAALYRSAIAIRAQVLARGFTGLCRRTLAPPKAELTLFKRFAATSKQLSVDVNTLTKVADGTAPSSAINVAQMKADGAAFDRAARILFKYRRPQKLSVCPHE
jgi:hypothetical protein